jgi:hypothetical protein
MRTLIEVHKATYSKFMLAASGEWTSAIAELPQEVQSERRAGMTSQLNWHINVQAEFYANRERWLDAAEGICRLIDSARASCTFSEAGVDFASGDDLARFAELMDAVQVASGRNNGFSGTSGKACGRGSRAGHEADRLTRRRSCLATSAQASGM